MESNNGYEFDFGEPEKVEKKETNEQPYELDVQSAVQERIESMDEKIYRNKEFANAAGLMAPDASGFDVDIKNQENEDKNLNRNKLKEKYDSHRDKTKDDFKSDTVSEMIKHEEQAKGREPTEEEKMQISEKKNREDIENFAKVVFGNTDDKKLTEEEKLFSQKLQEKDEKGRNVESEIHIRALQIERMREGEDKENVKSAFIEKLQKEFNLTKDQSERMYSEITSKETQYRIANNGLIDAVIKKEGGFTKTAEKVVRNIDEGKYEEVTEYIKNNFTDEIQREELLGMVQIAKTAEEALRNQDGTKDEEENKQKEKPKPSRELASSLKEHGALDQFNNMEFTYEEVQTMENMNQKAGTAALIAEVLKNDSQKIGSGIQGKILNVYVLIRLDTSQVEFIGEHAVREIVSPKSKYIIDPPNPEQFNMAYITMLAEQNGMSYYAGSKEGIYTNWRISKIFAGDLTNGEFITEDGANMQRAFLRIAAGGKEGDDEERALYEWGVKERGSDRMNETRLINIRKAFFYYMDMLDEKEKDYDDFGMNHNDVTTLCMAWDKNGFDKKTMPDNLDKLKSWTEKRLKAKDQNTIIEEMILDKN